LRDAFGDPVLNDWYWAGHDPMVLADGLGHSRLYVAHGGPTAPTCLDVREWNHRCAGQEVAGGTTEASFNRAWALDLVKAARGAGADVTYRPQPGGHWYGYSARFLRDAISNWGLFEPVPEEPQEWTYLTVSQTGEAWDLRFRFDSPPSMLHFFFRTANRLRGLGWGVVRIKTAGGCEFDAALPFEMELPSC
jgi:hypothetical protein